MTSSIGQRLRQAREEQEHTLEEAAHYTRIRERYLEAMEEDNFEALPTPFQQRGFLRSYAGFLGLAPEPLVEELVTGKAPTPEKSSPTDESSQAESEPTHSKLNSIGEKLKTQRELIGFSLEDVERQIHVKPRYLRAMEEGRFDDLPSSVQGRGMLNNYAEALLMDPEPLLLTFAEELQSRLKEKQAQQPDLVRRTDTELKEPSWMHRVFSQHLIVSALFAIVLAVIIVWSTAQVMQQRALEAQTTPNIPGVADMLLPSDTPTFTPEPTATVNPQAGIEVEIEDTAESPPEEEEAEDTEITPLPVEEGAIQIQLVIKQRAWVQITVDEEEVFNGRMLPGSVHVFSGEERIEILTGNAAGVSVFYGEREIGTLGVYGGVANLIFTANGIFTPTPTITPTPEDTATPTVTPRPTKTATTAAPPTPND